MLTVYRSIALTGKNFRTYLENYDLKNLRAQIDIHENHRKGEIFEPLSDNFIIVRCNPDLHLRSICTHLIYDFDNKICLRIGAFTNKEEDHIEITPEQIEDFSAEFSSEEFIQSLLPDETEGEIPFYGSRLGVISVLTTVDFSIKWENYRELRQEWLKEYFPVRGLSDNFENSLALLSNICSFDKEFLLKLSNYKINLIFKALANLNNISMAFSSIQPHKLPTGGIERAVEQKKFIDSHESLVFKTEDSLQNIYFFLTMLKSTSKGNMSFFKKITDSWITGKLTGEAEEKIEQAVVWMQSLN